MTTSAAFSQPQTAEKHQTVQPHGWLGRLTGWCMGLLNRKLNQVTVEQLHLAADDAVLEIGCGTGMALRIILAKTLCHRAAGIDASPEMIDEAKSKNFASVAAAQLDLRLGKVEALPWPEKSYTQVFAISNFHIWDSRRAGLAEILRVLRPMGRLTLCLRLAREKPRWLDQPGVTEQELAEDIALLQQVGFRAVEKFVIPWRQPVVLLFARKN